MTCGKTCALNDDYKKILDALAKSATPKAGKEIAAATGIEAKAVSCKMTALKKKGMVDSPERCKYAITAAGHEALKSA